MLVSSCLLGRNCKYNGGNNYNQSVVERLAEAEIIPVCPETLGGLSIPRSPSEIKGGSGQDVLSGRARVVDKKGTDISNYFISGAEKVLKRAERSGCRSALLKARSPSCGSQEIYDGSFSGRTKAGQGVTAALLVAAGIKLINEENLDKIGGRAKR